MSTWLPLLVSLVFVLGSGFEEGSPKPAEDERPLAVEAGADSTTPTSSPPPSDGSSQPPVPLSTIEADITLVVPCIPRDIGILEARLLPSILNQTVWPREVIIALSNTTDVDAKRLELKWSHTIPTLKVLATTAIQSPGQNRNRGATAASSKIVSFMDADDEMHRQRIQIIHEVMATQTTAKCVLHGFSLTSHSKADQFDWHQFMSTYTTSILDDVTMYECHQLDWNVHANSILLTLLQHERPYPWAQPGHSTCLKSVLDEVVFGERGRFEDCAFNQEVRARYGNEATVFVALPLSVYYPSEHWSNYPIEFLKVLEAVADGVSSTLR